MVSALPELASREAGEESILGRDERVRHRRQRVGQPGERVPASVPAPVDRRLRIAAAMCGERSRARRDVPELGVARDRRRRTTCSGGLVPRRRSSRCPLRPRSTLRPRLPLRTRDRERADARRASGRRGARPGRWSCHVSPRSVDRISPPSSIPARSVSASCGSGAIQRTCDVHGLGGKLQVGCEGSSSKPASSLHVSPAVVAAVEGARLGSRRRPRRRRR